MKHMKKYFALLAALLLCLTSLWGCSKEESQLPEDGSQTEVPTPDQQDQQPTVFSDTIECSNGSRTLRFRHNEAGQWEWKDDPDFPLDDSYVTALLATYEEMLAAQPITTDKTLKALGLEEDDTDKYLSVSNEKGETVTWYLGKKTDNGSYYMRRDGDQTFAIYLSPTDLSAQISRSIYAMMVLPQLPAITEEQITSVSIQDGETIHQLRNNGSGKWYNGALNVTTRMQDLLDQLAHPAVAACVDFKPSSGAPSICGLSKPAAVLTVEYVNHLDIPGTFVLSVGNPRGEGYCVTVNDDSTIYLMSAPLVNAVMAFVQ